MVYLGNPKSPNLCPAKKTGYTVYGYLTIASKRHQHLGQCLVVRAFEQAKIFIVPHLL
jgi:hypothetical protein